jgi:hypothetical protein
LEALNLYGITSSHRKTYGPVSSVIEKNNNWFFEN